MEFIKFKMLKSSQIDFTVILMLTRLLFFEIEPKVVGQKK